MSSYKPTGYPPGRPRRGEIRPDNPTAAYKRKWREENAEHYREQNRECQQRWRANNPERAREISRKAYIRKKAWVNINVIEV